MEIIPDLDIQNYPHIDFSRALNKFLSMYLESCHVISIEIIRTKLVKFNMIDEYRGDFDLLQNIKYSPAGVFIYECIAKKDSINVGNESCSAEDLRGFERNPYKIRNIKEFFMAINPYNNCYRFSECLYLLKCPIDEVIKWCGEMSIHRTLDGYDVYYDFRTFIANNRIKGENFDFLY